MEQKAPKRDQMRHFGANAPNLETLFPRKNLKLFQNKYYSFSCIILHLAGQN